MGKKSTSLSYLEGLHWAITESALNDILSQATENIEAFFDVGEAAKTPFKKDGDKAVIEVKGPLFKSSNILTILGIGSSIENLSHQFAMAVADPTITAITLNVASPGGEVGGTNAFSDQVFNARGIKPINAIIHGQAASAGYWIASAADTIEATDETDMIGSIGVQAVIKKQDSDKRVFISSNAPYKNPDPASSDGEKVYRGIVNNLEEIFIEKVARNRGVTTDYVKANFGKGGLVLAREALKVNMIDKLNGGTMEITKDMLKKDYKALVDELSAEATTPLEEQITALTAQVTALTNERDALTAQLVPADAMAPEVRAKFDKLEKEVLSAKLEGCIDEVKTSLMALHGQIGIDAIVAIGGQFKALQDKIATVGAAKGTSNEADASALIDAEIKALTAAGMSITDAFTAAHKKFATQ